MAVLWEKTKANTHYQITQAGNSIRLYTNKVFHSQWNPNTPITGQLWESLLLPVFFLNTDKPLKVLLLGVGGGAVVNLLNRFARIACLQGVELDPVHLQLARRWFKSEHKNVHYHCADAVEWLNDYRGAKFDLIIEDLFTSDQNGEVLRAVPADRPWFKLLTRNLVSKGVLAMNFESIGQAKRAWLHQARGAGLTHGGLLGSKRNVNAIGVFSRKALDVREFKARLNAHKDLDTRRLSCKLDFSYRKL